MEIRKDQIGFDRRIRLEWMELTVNLVRSNLSDSEIKQELLNELSKYLSVGKSSVNRGNGEKTASILTKVWVNTPSELLVFRKEAIRLLDNLDNEYHLAVYWGMTIAVYPFWAAVASQVGKLLKLQDIITNNQVHRRMQEIYGQRLVVKDATRRALSSMIEWGVLSESTAKATYKRGNVKKLSNPELVAWLIEAILHCSVNHKAPLRNVLNSDILFPFMIDDHAVIKIPMYANRFEIMNQGFDDKIVILTAKG